MSKKLFLIAALGVLSCSLMTGEEGATSGSWQGWVEQATGVVTAAEISEFKSALPQSHQKSFESAGEGTQALAVVIHKGLEATDPNMSDAYSLAYKIANKASVGYYMDQVKKRLNY